MDNTWQERLIDLHPHLFIRICGGLPFGIPDLPRRVAGASSYRGRASF